MLEIAPKSIPTQIATAPAGTLLAMTLAWLAAKGDERFDVATLMVSMQDFSRVGDTAVFLGEPAVDFIEQQMLEIVYGSPTD